ncbi:MAG: zinc ABC transporter substrate-binding protein [Oscillospiraceae bacterium]|nr:zinc ABC transporter substrate-binding protein [Oscillospiraceae bacterium]
MRRIISLIAAAAMFCLCACSPKGNSDTRSHLEADKLKIVTTIFPEYDWVKEIAGDNGADITLMLDSGVDLHSYQPTVDDILEISDCDMFIYIGGESDEWIEDALAEADNKNMVVLNLLDILGENAKEEEVVQGMQSSLEEAEYDEHIWLSLKNAKILCRAIADSLSEIDSKNASSYNSNADAYIKKLSELDNEYKAAIDSAPVKTLLFGGRFPFRYMTDDYGLNYYAAFAGCSAETEASFETILFLAQKADELGLNSIIQVDGSDAKMAETIRQSSNAQNILTLDAMQAVTSADIANGVTYISIMNKNLDVLKEALQ